MTIRYIVKCDLCGKEHELGWSREMVTEPRHFEKPDGWQMLKYTVTVNHQINLMICPVCDRAIREGRTVVSAYLDDKLTSEPVRIYTESEVIPLSDKFPKVSEEEANL